jgi:ribosomal protein S18 acetylase RimI-like enzyme
LSALGCPPDPPQVAWIRVFAVASGVSLGGSWKSLWDPARARLDESDVATAAALVSAGWMEPLLQASGFSLVNEVIFLEHRLNGTAQSPRHPGRLRPMQAADLAAVLALDEQAFSPLWRFSPSTLAAALAAAGKASVAEADGRLVGYHITTESPFGAHLARLAVVPEWQGRGLGRALAVEARRWAERRGLQMLSVNTQADNTASRRLYRSLGFAESGQVFPVYELPLGR